MKFTATDRVSGTIRVPGDKSISHRAVMLGALARGKTVIRNFLRGEDCISTIAAFRALGVDIADDGETITVTGCGGNLREPSDVINANNSGTTARLLLGVLAGQGFFSVLTGDESLRARPMKRVTGPLSIMGGRFGGRNEGNNLPIAVLPGRLHGIRYDLPVPSAQVKSALLLAGLSAEGETDIGEPGPSRDHTERMLRAFGGEIIREGNRIRIRGGQVLEGTEVFVPGDISSSAFFLTAAAMGRRSSVTVRDVGLNPTRAGLLEVLRAMGAEVEVSGERVSGGEPVGDITVRGGDLKGTVISGDLIPRLIDEIPVLAVAAALAEGQTEIRDAGELRVKETDRIRALVDNLRTLGVQVQETEDGMVIEGRCGEPFTSALIESRGDHRIAMAMAVAGLFSDGFVEISGFGCADISFPGFVDLLEEICKR